MSFILFSTIILYSWKGAEFLAYGMFRNASAVKERSKVTSTSIVVIKDENDNILSFDVEKKFQVKLLLLAGVLSFFSNIILIY